MRERFGDALDGVVVVATGEGEGARAGASEAAQPRSMAATYASSAS